MLCVICLRNNADITIVCENCNQLSLPNHNKTIDEGAKTRLLDLPMDRQFKIIKLTHKRFQSLLEYNLSREFILNNVLKEYIDMELRGDDLDMLVSDGKDPSLREFRPYKGRIYHQYTPPTKE